MADLFKEILPSIKETKKDVLENEKDYVSFVVNKALSYYPDCLLLVNEMNQLPGLTNRLQYQFYLQAIRQARRSYVKWEKSLKAEHLEAVKLYFGYSDVKALEAIRVLTPEQLQVIEKSVIP